VKFDPYDAGIAYAFVDGRWTKCHSEHFSTFTGRTEREIQIATEQLRAQSPALA
jgi:hypothetical protein